MNELLHTLQTAVLIDKWTLFLLGLAIGAWLGTVISGK